MGHNSKRNSDEQKTVQMAMQQTSITLMTTGSSRICSHQ